MILSSMALGIVSNNPERPLGHTGHGATGASQRTVWTIAPKS
jgi:hypothetical protein